MIIWCASYPKSGNTWIRAIIASLIYSQDGIFNFDLLRKIGQFPRRDHFNKLTDDYTDLSNLSKYWITAQEKINSDGKLRIFKTHNGNYNFSKNDFTNQKNTLGVIYIVRDPRNIISSLSNHFQQNFKISTDFLLNEESFLSNKGTSIKTQSPSCCKPLHFFNVSIGLYKCSNTCVRIIKLYLFNAHKCFWNK